MDGNKTVNFERISQLLRDEGIPMTPTRNIELDWNRSGLCLLYSSK